MREFIEAINADPSDIELREVFADWLEERGDETSAGWRWLNANRKTPEICSWVSVWNYPWNAASIKTHNVLPRMVIEVLDGYKQYETPFAALTDAANAIIQNDVVETDTDVATYYAPFPSPKSE